MIVALMSFNRPQYLKKVLQSIEDQIEDDYKIILFQDGAVNKYSWRKCANKNDIDECISLFKETFPQGETVISPTNIGVAQSFNEAEYLLFDERNCDEVLFLEDDMILSPYYFRIIKKLLDEFRNDERIGMVCAYGDINDSMEHQEKNSQMLKSIDHLWGYATTKKSWERRSPYYLEWYIPFISDKDYIQRDVSLISQWYEEIGYKPLASSQDAARTIAMLRAGQIGIATQSNCGQYIGAHGMHFHPQSIAWQEVKGRETYKGDISQFDYDDNTLLDIENALKDKWENF